MQTVGIIGGSGFIGSYNTQKFLAEGYTVKVSSTDMSKPEKYAHLKNLPNAQNLEIVPLNVENKTQLKDFLAGCEIVVHGGTPFQLDVQDPKSELLDPTINGTNNFLEAIQQTPSIKKVVFIASVAAFNTDFPLLPPNSSADTQIGEDDPPFMSQESHPYAQAKFIANQAVEQFIADHPNLSFDITTLSPVAVMGKALSPREDSTSMGLQFLFKNKIAPNPFIQMFFDNDIDMAIVDVEDVADCVYEAAIRTGIHGNNYLIASESYKVSDVHLILNHKTPIGQPKTVYKNERARTDLGIDFKPAMVPLREYSA